MRTSAREHKRGCVGIGMRSRTGNNTGVPTLGDAPWMMLLVQLALKPPTGYAGSDARTSARTRRV